MKKKFWVGALSAAAIVAPAAAVISCTPWDAPKDDLTGAGETTWHGIFHQNGRSLPKVGKVLSVKADGKTYKYTWTQADSDSDYGKGFLDSSKSQSDIINYIARKLANGKGDDVIKAIITAFGIPQHGVKFDPNFGKGTTPAPSKGEEKDLTGAGAGVWHGIFRTGGRSLPAAGDKFKVTTGGKDYTYTWTQADTDSADGKGYKDGSKTQSDIINYLARKLAGEDEAKAKAIVGAFAISHHNVKFVPKGANTEGSRDNKDSLNKGYHLQTTVDLTTDATNKLNGVLHTKDGVRTVIAIGVTFKVTVKVGTESIILTYQWKEADLASPEMEEWNGGTGPLWYVRDYIIDKLVGSYKGSADKAALKTKVTEKLGA